jgi:hypothetical protein
MDGKFQTLMVFVVIIFMKTYKVYDYIFNLNIFIWDWNVRFNLNEYNKNSLVLISLFLYLIKIIKINLFIKIYYRDLILMKI